MQAYRGKGQTHFALAASAEDFRTRNLVAHARADLLRPSFLFDCEVAGRVLTPQPRHLLVSGDEATRERLKRDFDAFGDAYFEERCVTGLKVKADKFKKMAANDEACARLTEFVSNAECQRLLISEGPKELVCFDTPPASHKKKLLYFHMRKIQSSVAFQ